MTLVLQRRLVGSALLLILIAITVWLLLDAVSQREINTDNKLVTPPIELNQPNLISNEQDAELVTPDITDFVPEAEQSIDVTETPDKQDKPENIESATIDEHKSVQSGEPQWILQIASFSILDNAKSLVETLEKEGYNAVVKTSVTQGKKIYRVQLLPQSDIEQLKKISKSLDSRFQLSSQILKHQ